MTLLDAVLFLPLAGFFVLLMLPNRVELWDVMLAAMKLGAIVLPTYRPLVGAITTGPGSSGTSGS